MPTDLPIRCSCGALHGVVRGASPSMGNRVVCYCDDCQLFAHFLGRPDEILDARGGTDVFQISPASLQIDGGIQKVGCMRLTASGILRWYTECCRMPIGNTLATPNLPLVGLIHTCIDREAAKTVDVVLGPVRARIFGRFAKTGLEGPPMKNGLSIPSVLRFSRLMLLWRLRGDHKRSPLFDTETGDPSAVPYVLNAEELSQLRAARSRWMAAA
jgi:hypothetical protein